MSEHIDPDDVEVIDGVPDESGEPEPIEDHEIDETDPIARRPYETRRSNAHLQAYAKIPPHRRTIAELGRIVGVDRGTLYKHRDKNDWDDRIDAYDRRQRQIADLATERSIARTHGRYYQALGKLADKVNAAVDNLDPVKMNGAQIVAAVNAINRGLALVHGDDPRGLEDDLDGLPTGPSTLESPGLKAVEKLAGQPDVLQALADALDES